MCKIPNLVLQSSFERNGSLDAVPCGMNHFQHQQQAQQQQQLQLQQFQQLQQQHAQQQQPQQQTFYMSLPKENNFFSNQQNNINNQQFSPSNLPSLQPSFNLNAHSQPIQCQYGSDLPTVNPLLSFNFLNSGANLNSSNQFPPQMVQGLQSFSSVNSTFPSMYQTSAIDYSSLFNKTSQQQQMSQLFSTVAPVQPQQNDQQLNLFHNFIANLGENTKAPLQLSTPFSSAATSEQSICVPLEVGPKTMRLTSSNQSNSSVQFSETSRSSSEATRTPAKSVLPLEAAQFLSDLSKTTFKKRKRNTNKLDKPEGAQKKLKLKVSTSPLGSAKDDGEATEDLSPISSKFRGVSWHRRDRVWLARAWVDGKIKHLGCFKQEELAALVVDLKLLEVYGENAKAFNFPDPEKRLEMIEGFLEKGNSKLRRFVDRAGIVLSDCRPSVRAEFLQPTASA